MLSPIQTPDIIVKQVLWGHSSYRSSFSEKGHDTYRIQKTSSRSTVTVILLRVSVMDDGFHILFAGLYMSSQ